LIAEKFCNQYNASNLKKTSSPTFTKFSSHQVHALYQLKHTIKTCKPLFNLQLAATHLAFMLDHDSNAKVKDMAIRTSMILIRKPRISLTFRHHPMLSRLQMRCLSSTLIVDRQSHLIPRSSNESATLASQFDDLLASLSDDDKYDHLRLPLQVSALLSPIFLLYDAPLHKSKVYCQRYKMMLVCILHSMIFSLMSIDC